MVTVRDTSLDVAIYIVVKNEKYRLRYELLETLSTDIILAIDKRMRKSYSIDRLWPDAHTESSILQKARLMKDIFKLEFGLTAEVIETV